MKNSLTGGWGNYVGHTMKSYNFWKLTFFVVYYDIKRGPCFGGYIYIICFFHFRYDGFSRILYYWRMTKIFLLILSLFIFKFGKMISKFDISENIGHSHKQRKEHKYDWSIRYCNSDIDCSWYILLVSPEYLILDLQSGFKT